MVNTIIAPALITDADALWDIIREVIHSGDTYAFEPHTAKEKMIHYWMGSDKRTYVARLDSRIAGTFILKDNQPGLGNHIANAAYMVHPEFQRLGLGKKMATFSLKEAKRLGYKAMQFNLVVASNKPAIKLWEDLGFEIIGKIPNAFRHKTLGFINALIMYKDLER